MAQRNWAEDPAAWDRLEEEWAQAGLSASTGQPSFTSWARAYEQEHGGLPGEVPTQRESLAQAMSNAQWGEGFRGATGNAPGQNDWVQHYWRPDDPYAKFKDTGQYWQSAAQVAGAAEPPPAPYGVGSIWTQAATAQPGMAQPGIGNPAAIPVNEPWAEGIAGLDMSAGERYKLTRSAQDARGLTPQARAGFQQPRPVGGQPSDFPGASAYPPAGMRPPGQVLPPRESEAGYAVGPGADQARHELYRRQEAIPSELRPSTAASREAYQQEALRLVQQEVLPEASGKAGQMGVDYPQQVLTRFSVTPEARQWVRENVRLETHAPRLRGRGGGGWYDQQSRIQYAGGEPEAIVHEAAHSWWHQKRLAGDNASAFMQAVVRASQDPDPQYAIVRKLADGYVNGTPDDGWAGLLVENNDWEMFAGLMSGTMGQARLMPPYVRAFYDGFLINAVPGSVREGLREEMLGEDQPRVYASRTGTDLTFKGKAQPNPYEQWPSRPAPPPDEQTAAERTAGSVAPAIALAQWVTSLFKPPGTQPIGRGIPLGPELTDEAQVAAAYARAAAAGLTPMLATALVNAAPAFLVASAVPFASYAASPVTRERTATQAGQIGQTLKGAWDWLTEHDPLSVGGIAKWLSGFAQSPAAAQPPAGPAAQMGQRPLTPTVGPQAPERAQAYPPVSPVMRNPYEQWGGVERAQQAIPGMPVGWGTETPPDLPLPSQMQEQNAQAGGLLGRAAGAAMNLGMTGLEYGTAPGRWITNTAANVLGVKPPDVDVRQSVADLGQMLNAGADIARQALGAYMLLTQPEDYRKNAAEEFRLRDVYNQLKAAGREEEAANTMRRIQELRAIMEPVTVDLGLDRFAQLWNSTPAERSAVWESPRAGWFTGYGLAAETFRRLKTGEDQETVIADMAQHQNLWMEMAGQSLFDPLNVLPLPFGRLIKDWQSTHYVQPWVRPVAEGFGVEEAAQGLRTLNDKATLIERIVPGYTVEARQAALANTTNMALRVALADAPDASAALVNVTRFVTDTDNFLMQTGWPRSRKMLEGAAVMREFAGSGKTGWRSFTRAAMQEATAKGLTGPALTDFVTEQAMTRLGKVLDSFVPTSSATYVERFANGILGNKVYSALNNILTDFFIGANPANAVRNIFNNVVTQSVDGFSPFRGPGYVRDVERRMGMVAPEARAGIGSGGAGVGRGKRLLYGVNSAAERRTASSIWAQSADRTYSAVWTRDIARNLQALGYHTVTTPVQFQMTVRLLADTYNPGQMAEAIASLSRGVPGPAVPDAVREAARVAGVEPVLARVEKAATPQQAEMVLAQAERQVDEWVQRDPLAEFTPVDSPEGRALMANGVQPAAADRQIDAMAATDMLAGNRSRARKAIIAQRIDEAGVRIGAAKHQAYVTFRDLGQDEEFLVRNAEYHARVDRLLSDKARADELGVTGDTLYQRLYRPFWDDVEAIWRRPPGEAGAVAELAPTPRPVAPGGAAAVPGALPITEAEQRATDLVSASDQARRLPPTLVNQLWDVDTGLAKRVRSKRHGLVPWSSARIDSLATEYGYADGEAFMKAVQQEAEMMVETTPLRKEMITPARMRQLRRQMAQEDAIRAAERRQLRHAGQPELTRAEVPAAEVAPQVARAETAVPLRTAAEVEAARPGEATYITADMSVTRTPRQRAQAGARYDREAREAVARAGTEREVTARASAYQRHLRTASDAEQVLLSGTLKGQPLTPEQASGIWEILAESRKSATRLAGTDPSLVERFGPLPGRTIPLPERGVRLSPADRRFLRSETVVPVQPVAGAAREPWQMTRDEYRISERVPEEQAYRPEAEARAIAEDATLEERQGRAYVGAEGGPTQTIGAPNAGRQRLDAIDAHARVVDRHHRRLVEAALREGQPVPANVLADYPDLRAPAAPGEIVGGTLPGVPQLSQALSNTDFPTRAQLGEQMRTVLRQVREALTAGRQPIEPLSPQALAMLRGDGFRQLRDSMQQSRLFAVRTGAVARDFTLHNYGQKTGLDLLASIPLMYPFWASRTYPKTFMRALMHPNVVATYLRYKRALHEENKDLPPWYRDQLRVQLPWLPEPYLLNIEAMLNPVYQLTQTFERPGQRDTQLGEWAYQMDRFGFSPHWWMTSADTISRALSGDTEGARAAASYLSPQTRAFRAATGLMGMNEGRGITVEPWLWTGSTWSERLKNAGTGGDYWDWRQVGGYIANKIVSGEWTPAQGREAAIRFNHSEVDDPLVLEALQAQMRERGLPTLVGYLGGAGLKYRPQVEAEREQKWAELGAIYDGAEGMSEDEFYEKMGAYYSANPEMSYINIARSGRDKADLLYFQDVVRSIPPNQWRLVLPQYDPTGEVFPVIERLKEQLAVASNSADREHVWNNMTPEEKRSVYMVTASAAADFPPVSEALGTEWREVGRRRGALYDRASAEWPGMAQRENEYYALASDLRKAYLEAYPALQAYWDWKHEIVKADPLMQWYYGDPPREQAVDGLWDLWWALPSSMDKTKLLADLGNDFETYFVDKDTRDNSRITNEQLFTWTLYVADAASQLEVQAPLERTAQAEALGKQVGAPGEPPAYDLAVTSPQQMGKPEEAQPEPITTTGGPGAAVGATGVGTAGAEPSLGAPVVGGPALSGGAGTASDVAPTAGEPLPSGVGAGVAPEGQFQLTSPAERQGYNEWKALGTACYDNGNKAACRTMDDARFDSYRGPSGRAWKVYFDQVAPGWRTEESGFYADPTIAAWMSPETRATVTPQEFVNRVNTMKERMPLLRFGDPKEYAQAREEQDAWQLANANLMPRTMAYRQAQMQFATDHPVWAKYYMRPETMASLQGYQEANWQYAPRKNYQGGNGGGRYYYRGTPFRPEPYQSRFGIGDLPRIERNKMWTQAAQRWPTSSGPGVRSY